MMVVMQNRMVIIMAFMAFIAIIAFKVIEMVILMVIENLQNVVIVDVQAWACQIMEIVIIINLMEKKVSSFLPIRFLICFYP